jgi:tetratricopeptide (TPR) repeat protein
MAKKTKAKKKTRVTAASKTTQAISETVSKQKWWMVDNRWKGILLMLAVTFAVYSPSLDNDFVNWDDDKNFYENEVITTLSGDNFWANTKEIFTTDVIGNYNPLSIWSFAIDKMIYGLDNPGGWHLTNILLHLLCVILVYRLALLLGLGKWGSLFTTLLFALHPMRVESVAWVTERKDVLYGVFYLGALTLYAKHREQLTTKVTLWIILLFVLSLLSKIQAVSLPLSMICIDYLATGRLRLKQWITKWPYFLLSLFFGILGIMVLGDQGSLEATASLPLWQRFFIGSYSFVVYLMKVVIPYELSPLYPYPATIGWQFYASMIIAPITIMALWWSYKQERRSIFFGLSFFIVNIVFLLQILGAGQGFLADRFTYIAYFGLFFTAGYAVDKVSSKGTLVAVLAGIYIAVLAAINYKQNDVWQNSDTLWTHVLKYYDKTTLPYGNRANYLRDNGEVQRAIADYNQAIALKDNNPQAYNSRGKLYFNFAKGRDTLLLALNDYNKAIQYAPKDGEFYVNRGATYARLGDIDRAIQDMDTGIQLKPGHAVGYLNRSVMYNQKGDFANAVADIDRYLQLRPYNADMWYEKGRALRQLGKPQESISAFGRAIEIKGDKGIYYYERGRTRGYLSDKAGARADLQRAIEFGYTQIDPAFRADIGM